MKNMKNEDIEDRIKLINQLREAEAWLEIWSNEDGLSDEEIENRIRLVNQLQEAEAAVVEPLGAFLE